MEMFELSIYDIPVVALWIATIVGLLVIAWEPYQRSRKLKVVALEHGARTVLPIYIFVPAVFVGLAPFAMLQMPFYEGLNPWIFPHLLMSRIAIFFALAILFQLGLRKAFLDHARRVLEHQDTIRRSFEAGD